LSHGLNAIHYTPAGPQLEQMPIDVSFLNQQLTLVYTGKPHHSGLNNWTVLKSALDGEPHTRQALLDLKRVADDVYLVCQRGEWSRLTELFRREYRARVALSEGFSSPEIRRLEEVVLKAGADAVKICGAGGGGCVLVWSSPDRKPGVESACKKAGFEVLDAAVVASQQSQPGRLSRI
jgi:D-glycero-alpha-D-manno-heptose-7-phosphate kinase